MSDPPGAELTTLGTLAGGGDVLLAQLGQTDDFQNETTGAHSDHRSLSPEAGFEGLPE